MLTTIGPMGATAETQRPTTRASRTAYSTAVGPSSACRKRNRQEANRHMGVLLGPEVWGGRGEGRGVAAKRGGALGMQPRCRRPERRPVAPQLAPPLRFVRPAGRGASY